VDQDSLGVQGWIAEQPSPGLQVWVKPLAGGARAVLLLNRTDAEAPMRADWSAVGLRAGRAKVRDLWAHEDRGTFTGSYTATVPSHAVALVTLSPLGGR
jgi:alpha-galactosidase